MSEDEFFMILLLSSWAIYGYIILYYPGHGKTGCIWRGKGLIVEWIRRADQAGGMEAAGKGRVTLST